MIKNSIDFSLKKIQQNLETFSELVPPAASENLVYQPEGNTDWTASFWVGQLFLAKEIDGSDRYDQVIENQLKSFETRLKNKVDLETHDIGFLYILSTIADYKLNRTPNSKLLAIQAADLLMERYNEKAGIIQAWGNLEDDNENGRIIIDCLMNLPLLYFASNETGDESYRDAAYRHAKQTQKYIVRDNFTTYHSYFFDTQTGEAKFGKTVQGYSDDSCWARGQAWGIYGFTLSYLYTGDVSFIETAKHLADYFISHLPADNVPFWDLIFNDGDDQERDSSSAAIAICGLLELAKQLPLSDSKRESYEKKAYEILQSLSENYTTKNVPYSNGLLIHGVYNKNGNVGVDECMSWGDYFYMESLTRFNQVWNRYW
ncbi:MAG: glycoside hydrolase family 88 protein [Streptococcaceae bacterium]|jgi:unsaturated chondroitin disaccharide hydrolase|nr:glycoside hydrolase family 88 protein [Streptococcaceae bacterium]